MMLISQSSSFHTNNTCLYYCLFFFHLQNFVCLTAANHRTKLYQASWCWRDTALILCFLVCTTILCVPVLRTMWSITFHILSPFFFQLLWFPYSQWDPPTSKTLSTYTICSSPADIVNRDTCLHMNAFADNTNLSWHCIVGHCGNKNWS